MSSDLTPGLEAFLAAQAHRKSFTDMSVAQINALTPGEFARLTGRQLVVQPTTPAVPGTPRTTKGEAADHSPQPEPLDVASMGLAQYAELRREPKPPTPVGLYGTVLLHS
jgi:hypothetical protein